MNPDGSMTNNVGYTTRTAGQPLYISAAAASIQERRDISPSEQYNMASEGAFAHAQITGDGPPVKLASGKVVNAGTVFTTGDGYRFIVNDNGSVTDLDTGHTSGNGTTHYDPDTNTWVTVGSGGSSTGSSGSSTSSGSSSPSQSGASSTHDALMAQQTDGYRTDQNGDVVIAMNGEPARSNPMLNQWGMLNPVVLDLDGNGISLTEQSSSNVFMDTAGDGKQHRTAWAGAGDGVLVRDDGNDGIISRRNEIDFTAWDPTAKSDMQALRDIFDTNHNNQLDSGDDDWSLFKVMVTNADGTNANWCTFLVRYRASCSTAALRLAEGRWTMRVLFAF